MSDRAEFAMTTGTVTVEEQTRANCMIYVNLRL